MTQLLVLDEHTPVFEYSFAQSFTQPLTSPSTPAGVCFPSWAIGEVAIPKPAAASRKIRLERPSKCHPLIE
jgi:hypothetical protein